MRKNAKKLICAMMAMIMILAMGVTTFAAESPVANGVVTAVSAKDKNGNTFNYSLGKYNASYGSAVAYVQSNDGLKATLGDAYVEGMQVVDVRSVTLENAGNVTYPLTVTLKVPGVIAGTKVAVMAYVNGQWVVLKCTAGDGVIDITFDDASQLEMIAVIADKNTATSEIKTATGTVSPKTGETAPITAMAFAAVVLLIGGSYCLRKREVR